MDFQLSCSGADQAEVSVVVEIEGGCQEIDEEEHSRDVRGLVRIIKGMPEGLVKAQLKLACIDAARSIWVFCCDCYHSLNH